MADITVIIPNRTHAFPINIKGTVVSNENSGTDIFAFVGSQKATPVDTITGPLQYTLDIVETNMIAGEITKDLENKKFVMAEIDGSSVGIENNLPSLLDLNSDNIASFRNIPLVRGQLQFTVVVSDESGTLHTKVETCNYTKSRSLFTTDTIFIEVGTVLNASTDSVVDPEGIKEVIQFAWYRDGEAIDGQTQSSYTVSNADVGHEISADLKYIDGKNNEKSVLAIQNIFIVDSAPINFPIVSGIPESGQTLTADTSFIYDRNGIESEIAYDWHLDGVSTGLTGSSYDIQEGELDVGKTLQVYVSYTDGAEIENILSSSVLTVRDSAAGDTVVITGTPKIGQLLEASLQTADGTQPTILSYEWRRGGRVISGATSSSYRIKRADFNSFLTVTIEYDTGSGTVKYKTSELITFQNSTVSGTPTLARVLEDGTISTDLGSGISVGSEISVDVSSITDPDDIKDFYYSFDSLTNESLLRDSVSLNSVIGHNAITTRRSSRNQVFLGTSDEIVYEQDLEVQSIYIDNSLGNSGDEIFVQYKDSSDVWQNALRITGKASRFFLLDNNLSSKRWRLSFIFNSEDSAASSYTFEASWSLESPSTTETRKFIYQWQRTVNGEIEDIIGARKKNYLLSQADLNSDISAKVTFVDGANNIVNLETNSATVLNYAPTGKVTIEGTPKIGFVLTAKAVLKDKDNITADNTDGTVSTIDSYQWYLDDVAVEGATSQTFLLQTGMETKRASVEATYTDISGVQHTVRSRTGRRINASPRGAIKIYGTPKVGKLLTIDTAELSDLNQFNQLFYQWILVEGNNETQIPNAALQSYTVKNTDVGKSIRANVYYTDNDGFQEIVSTNTIAILDSETTGEPSIDGVIVFGQTVTANVSNITDENGIASYSYQWRIDEKNVDGATFSTFTITANQDGTYGKIIDVAVTVTDNSGNEKTIYSNQQRIALAAGTVGADGGTITGENVSLTLQANSVSQDTVIYIYETTTGEEPTLPEGSTLVGTAWAFTPHGTTFSEPITIEFEVPEGTNLVLRADDENDNTFEIVENYSITGTTATLETNTFSVYVGSVFTPAVITGDPQQGNYLTASVSGDVADVSFQWRRNGTNILNGQGDLYLVKKEDVGQMLTVAATFTDVNGVSTTKVSAETEVLNTPAQGEVKINGSRRVGITLESEIISLTDINDISGSDYSYQWLRNSSPINGATQSTYEVVQDDFLKDLSVNVSFTDGVGNTETVQSEEVFISKKGSIFFTSNSRKQGDTLTIDTSTLNDFYSIFNRQFTWYADGQPISQSDSRNRTLATFESGKTIKAAFTYTDGRGTNEVLETDERFIYTISDRITTAGGTISGNGITINVPAGAVTEDVDILVYVVPYEEGQLPIGTLSDEVAYAFTPLDLAFEQPITITLPKPNEEYDMVLFGSNNSVDEFIMSDEDFLTIDDNNNTITIQTDNFGVFMSAILYVRVDIVGTPEQGQTLGTVFTGEVFSKDYQWYRGEVPLDGETNPSYTVVLQDVGQELKVVSNYLLESGSSPEVVESEPVLIVNSQPVVDTSAIISGEDRVGETITASPSGISDANNPGGLSGFLYQWKVNGQDIDGETNTTLTIRPEHFNKNITVEITYVDATGLLESVTSDNFYITRIPPSGYVEVIGIPEVDEYLEVDTDNLVDLNGIGEFSYQWHADNIDLVNETSASLLVTSDMEDKAISVTLTYTDGVGEVETVTSRNAPVIDADPTGAVVIDYAKLEVAQTLTANTSTIADANQVGTFSYQWYSDGVAIAGATNKNYVVANQFCNTNITVTATYTDGDGYIESLTSEPVFIVNSPVQGFPVVTGTPGVSETLTINTNNLSDVNVLGTFSYKWFADGEEIVGATAKTWVVAANSYVGKRITGQVSYVDGAGNSEQVSTSNGLVVLNSPPEGKPVINGILQVGQTLTVDPSQIEDFNVIATDFSYQWYANNIAIANETGSTYVVQVSDINKNISVDASYTDEGNTLETVRSNNYKIINTPGTATVLITNTGLEQGDILSSSVISQDDNIRVSDYSYQWKRDGAAIMNANESTYKLGRLDWDKEITLQVSFTDTGGFVETFQSENSASMVNSFPTGDIVITGSNKVGEVVEVDISEIEDKNEFLKEDRVLNYTITSGGSFIQRELGFTEGEISKIVISVEPLYNFKNLYLYVNSPTGWQWKHIDQFQHSSNTKFGSSGIGSRTLEFNYPIIGSRVRFMAAPSYNIQVYQKNTKDTERFSYQWYRDGQMLSGSTEKTYTTTFDDLYKTLTADVSYADDHGNIEIPNNTASFDIVNSPPEGTVLIGGTTNVGDSLFFTHNVVDRDNVTVDNPTGLVTFSTFQWYKSDSETGPLTPITEATGSTLLLTKDLEAKWIALDATYIDIEGDDDLIHASNRLPVKAEPTGEAAVSYEGVEVGRQILLDTSTIADLNDLGPFSYQWYRTEGTGSTAISGAVQTHYSFQPEDLGEKVYVVVSYTDGDGYDENVTSSYVGPIIDNVSSSVGTVSITDRVEIGGTIESDLENILVMNNFETVAPVVAYNFYKDARDVSPNLLHLVGNNYSFDAEGGLDLSKSTSAYLRTQGTTPVLNNDTHTIAFRVKITENSNGNWRKIFTYGRTFGEDRSPGLWWSNTNNYIHWRYDPSNLGQDISLNINQWYDIVGIKYDNLFRVYIDGVLLAETTVTKTKAKGDSIIVFGADSSNHAAPVIIKDFQIFDFAVDAYTSASNYPFYTEPTLSLQWKADGAPIAGATGSVYQVPADNNQLAKDITLEVSFLDALGNAKAIESNSSIVVESDLQGELSLLINNQDIVETTDLENVAFLLLSKDDSSSTTSFKDYSLNNHSITRNSGDVYRSTTESKFSGASLYFDGSGDRLYTPHDSSLNIAGGDWTIEAWIYPDGDYGTYRTIISKRDGNYQEWQLYLRTGNGVLSFYNGTQYNSSTTPVANEWSHVAAVRSGTTVTLYLNGESVGSWDNIDARNSSRPLYVGSIYRATEVFKGYIDSVRVTKEALYTENFDVPTTEFISVDNIYVGETISVDVSDVTDLNGLVSTEYQWYADNSPLLDATGSSYVITQEEINKDIRVKAVFEDETGRKSARLSNEVLVVNTPATGSVTITSFGTFEINNVLYANPSISDDNGIVNVDFDYQWMIDGADIPGEINRTYIPTNKDVGKQISVKASFVDKGYTVETITSDSIEIPNSVGTGEVQILGQSSVGSILTVDVSGIADPNGIFEFIYQWKRDGVAIDGATSQSYALVDADYNKNITVDVSYIDNSNVVLNIDAKNSDSYSGTGTTVYDLSGYDNNGSLRNGVEYNTKEHVSFSLEGSDDNISIPRTIDPTKPYSIVQWVKPRVALADTTNSSSRKTPLKGDGHWNPGYWMTARIFRVHAHTEYRDVTIDWRNDTGWHQIGQIYDGTTCYAIIDGQKILGSRTAYGPGIPSNILVGAETNGSSGYNWDGYVSQVTVYNKELTQDEVENLYMAHQDIYSLDVVTQSGTTNLAFPTNTASVYVDKATPTGTVSIEGTREVLNTLTATNTIEDLDGVGTLNYQWYRNGNPIAGANQSTFEIPGEYIGSFMSVSVSYLDGNGKTETFISEEVEINNPPYGSVTIVGTAKKGQTLSVDTTDFYDTNGRDLPLASTREGLILHLPVAGATSNTRIKDYSTFGDDYVNLKANDEYIVVGMTKQIDENGIPYFEYDGGSSYDRIYNSSTEVLTGVTDFTFESWVNVPSSPGNTMFLSYASRDGNQTNELIIARRGSGFHLYKRGSLQVNVGSGIDWKYDEWSHFAVTLSNTTVKIYINGELQGSWNISTSYTYALRGNGSLVFGQEQDSYQGSYDVNDDFHGKLAEIRMYNRGLSEEEITANYSLGITKKLIVRSYQWQRNSSFALYENIDGATSATYAPTNADVDKKIRVVVSYTDAAGFENEIISEPVLVENTLPTGNISFSGTFKTGNTISSDISNVVDQNGFSSIPTYQWKLDGVPVGGDSNSYTIASNDVGKELSLTISFVDGLGYIESVTTVAGTIENSNPENLLKWSNPSKIISSLYENIQTITNPSPNSSDYFGHSVAVSGDGSTMVVGSHGQDLSGYSNNGAIYIYKKDQNGQWDYVQNHSTSHSDAQLGVNVDINYDGSVIVAGAFAYDYGTTNSGRVFIHTKNNSGTWTQTQAINASDYESYAYFGRHVSVSDDGNTIAVGAYADDVSYSDTGAVYIYTRSGSTWGNQKKIYASRRYNSYLFGFGLSLSGDGNTLAVGAHGEYYNYDNDGAVYMFTKDGSGNWTERQRIMNNVRRTNDYFGYAVKLSQNGDVLVVGSHGEDNRGTDSGAAYMYTRSGNTWSYVQELVPQGNDSYDNFGVWLSMTPDSSVIAVGANREDTTAGDSGAVYIFEKSTNSNTWRFVEKIKSTQITSSGRYGYGIDLSDNGQDLVVGQYGYSSNTGLVVASSLSPTFTTDSSAPFALYNGAIISLDVSDIVDADSIIEESKNYRWYRIENSTETLISENREYKIRDEDLGKSLKAEFEYLDGGGTIQTLNLVVNIPTDNLQIDGDLFVGNTVSIESNDSLLEESWKIFKYEWRIGGKVVSTEPTYEIKPEDLGQHLVAKQFIYVDGELQNILRAQSEITLSRSVINRNRYRSTNYDNQIFYDFTMYSSTNSYPEDLVSGKDITWVNSSVGFSKTDGALFTHGSTDSLRTDVTDILDNDTHTIALRIKFNSNYNGNWYKIFSYGRRYSEDSSPGLWWKNDQNEINWRYNPGNTGINIPIDINEWNDIVGVKNGDELKIYINGILYSTETVVAIKSEGVSYLQFGWDGSANSAPISIRRATIIPQALNEEQIKTVLDNNNTQIELTTDNYRKDYSFFLEGNKYIPSPPSGDHDYYGRRGFDISGDGNTLVIGASLADNTQGDSGAVYIYERQQDGTWGNEIRLMPPSQQSSAQWGHAVKLNADGTTLAVVAPYHDNGYYNVGYFSIYRKQANGSWSNVYNRSGYTDERYGEPGRQYNIDISDDGNIVVVGADREDGSSYNVYNEGRFHIYEYYNGSWRFVEYEPTGDDNAYTGFSVSISGDGNYIVVGAPYYDSHDQGYVWIYKRNGVNNWSSIQGLRPEGGYRTHNGWKVSFSSDSRILAISARHGDQRSYWTENRWGRVYVYENKFKNILFDEQNKTMTFNGSNTYARIPHNSSKMDFRYGQTIAMWLKPGSGANNLRRNPYDQAYGGPGTITHESNGTFNYYFGTNGGNGSSYAGRTSSFSVIPGEEAFIVVTRDQATNTVKWYKNGQLLDTLDAGGYSQTANGSNPITIGSGYTGHKFIGEINYVSTHNRALTEAEVQRLYNATKVDTQLSLVAPFTGDTLANNLVFCLDANYSNIDSFYWEDLSGNSLNADVYYPETTWSHISTLGDSTNVNNDYFGDSLVVSGDGQRIVVGTPYRDEAGTDTGKITIFKRTEGTNSWERERQILGSSLYPRLGQFRLRTNFDASTILAGYNPGMMFIEQNVEIVEKNISIDTISANVFEYNTRNENTSVEYFIGYEYQQDNSDHLFKFNEIPNSIIKVPKKVSLPFIETVKEQLLYSNWYSHSSKLIGTGSSIDLEDSIIKFSNIKHEYAYKNYKNEIIKDSSTVYFVRTNPDSLEYWLKHENNFILDLDSIFVDSTEFEIAKVEILGGFPLPSWLSYNTSTNVISGIPSSQFFGNISLHVLLKRPAYKETTLENFELGVVLDLKVRANDNKTITTHKQYDWTGVENPNSFVSTHGLTSTRNWDGKFQIASSYNPFWDKEAVMEENFEVNWRQEQELMEGEGYNTFRYKSYYEEDLQFLQDESINPSPSWSGAWQIHNRFVPKFEQHAEKLLEENFDDLSWSGYTRVDWTGVEDPIAVSSEYNIDGFTEVEERFQWTSIPKPTFMEEKVYLEEFEDNSWTGFTRVDWYGIQDPSSKALDYNINAYWEGIHNWGGHPQPQFSENKLNTTEEFEDPTWSGYTRIDWNNMKEEERVSIVSVSDISAFWEGRFKWSERAQPSFADKSLVSVEDFEEDWTI